MENQSRIEELLAESLRRSDQILEMLDASNARANTFEFKLDHLIARVDNLSDRMDGVEAEIRELKKEVTLLKVEAAKLNLVSAENSRSLMKLAENIERIDRLEKAIFKK